MRRRSMKTRKARALALRTGNPFPSSGGPSRRDVAASQSSEDPVTTGPLLSFVRRERWPSRLANEGWRLIACPSRWSTLVLSSAEGHFDLGNLPDDLAAQLGRFRSRRSSCRVSRAHCSCPYFTLRRRGAHCTCSSSLDPKDHSVRGNFFTVWDDLLAPVPRAVRDADACALGSFLPRP